MSKILVKTRGESSPQGKPRVYFSAHHDDYRAFFEPVSDEILKLQNCAIYYDEEPQQPYDEEELFLSLSQMQLFVMPVTTKLLTTPSRAIDVEFKYAIEHHIPVLPLMQEGGLEELFNKKCGDLQFLTKERKDMTELPYEEKLEKYLSSILIGDELAKKVRAAFDAYIFLSYRKKDRKYAQELMRLIHKNEFCRDIAIWYDEFLTPGENFNDAIGEALNKSRLFALAVTPNLVNEKNYVMTTEYPMAKKAGKNILPVEMVKTNRLKLKMRYKGIPNCTEGDDEAGLSESLTELLHDLAIKENDDDPQHNFFIGLAYLGGIDIEVDHERAVKLITFAAEKGLPEAIEKLVSMYRSGEVVERNYHTAIEWQRKLVDARKAVFEKEPSEDSAIRYLNAVWNLGDYIHELRNLAEAKKVYTQMLDVCLKIYSNHFFGFIKRYIAVSYNKLGDISKAEGDIAGAKGYYAKSLGINEAIATETGTVQSRCDLAISYDNLGIIYKTEGDIADAEIFCKRAFELRAVISRETGTVESRRDLSISYDRLGNISKAEGDIMGAKAYYAKSLEIREAISNEMGTVESRRDLSISYNNLGDISKAEGDIAGAKDYYIKSLEVREAMVEETCSIEALCDLLISNRILGHIYYEENDIITAELFYLKVVEIDEIISKETAAIEVRKMALLTYERLSNICKAYGDIAGAEAYYVKSLEIFEAIAKETGTVESRRELYIRYEKLGDISCAEGDIASEKYYYLKSLEIREGIANETNTIESHRKLSLCYEKLGDISRAEGDIIAAKTYYTKSLEIVEMFAHKTGSYANYSSLVEVYFMISFKCDEEERHIYLKKAFEILDILSERYPKYIDELCRKLSLHYEKLNDVSHVEGDIVAAKSYYKKLFERVEVIVHKTGSFESYSSLAEVYFGISFECDEEERRIYLEKALKILDILVERCPNNTGYLYRRRKVKTELAKSTTPIPKESFWSKLARIFKRK